MSRSPAVSAVRNAERLAEYAAAGARTGPLTTPAGEPTVQYRRVASPRQRLVIGALGILNAGFGLAFIGWLLMPGSAGLDGQNAAVFLAVHMAAAATVVLAQVSAFSTWVFAYHARNPVPWTPAPGQRIALLTTIVPTREPLSMLETTLTALTAVRYDGPVDVWILDEGDDERVKTLARRLGVRHFSRKGRPEYNRPEGQFRVKCKAGNHNAWLAAHGAPYDVVVQMDPDHVPFPWLLERCLGYFRDPDVAFVALPHVYGNRHDNLVTYGASALMFPWNSVVLRGGNGLGSPILEGANHAYRTAAWQLIGGYQDALSEDRLTSMRILGMVNPATGRPFTGVYTPDVLTVGEAPSTWTDWFNQQKRWSYGLWQIYLTRTRRDLVKHNFRQFRTCAGFLCHDLCKPVETLWLTMLGLLTAAHLLLGAAATGTWSVLFLLWVGTLAGIAPLPLWLRRFHATAHERSRLGLRGLVLRHITAPIITGAGFAALLGRPLSYVVTAKGQLKSTDTLRTFRLHLCWAAVLSVLLGCCMVTDRAALTMRANLAALLVTALAPVILWLADSALGRGGSRIECTRDTRRPRGQQARRTLRRHPQPTALEAAQGRGS
ncbi:glycosyltransferase [Nocardia vulneris]|uniref:glycosyltransferase family 2 protein n=1 Tax=Nocardia vulneris TaxID=1141657 RepID=UPI0030D35B80